MLSHKPLSTPRMPMTEYPKRMRKGLRLFYILWVLLLGPAIAGAGQPRSYRVGVLHLEPEESTHNSILNGFLAGLQDSGYVEGKNLILDMAPRQTIEELRAVARLFRETKMDAIVAIGSTEASIAKAATEDIPIVFLPARDVLRAQFVKSLARPDGNLTGITWGTGLKAETKSLSIFKEVNPALGRVLVLSDSRIENPHRALDLSLLYQVARHLGIELFEKPVRSVAETVQLVSSLSNDQVDGIFFVCSSLFKNLRKLGRLANRKKIALYGCSALHVAEHQALAAYAPDLFYLGYRGAWYIDRILKGNEVRALPVEMASRHELVINLSTAKAIGLTIPPEVLILADKVIR